MKKLGFMALAMLVLAGCMSQSPDTPKPPQVKHENIENLTQEDKDLVDGIINEVIDELIVE